MTPEQIADYNAKIAARKAELEATKTPGKRGRVANGAANKASAAKIAEAELRVLNDRLALDLAGYRDNGTPSGTKAVENANIALHGGTIEQAEKRLISGSRLPNFLKGSKALAKEVRDANSASISLAEDALYASLRVNIPGWVWEKFTAEVKAEGKK